MKKLYCVFICVLCFSMGILSSCQKTIDLNEYVSEYRKAIYQASNEEISLTIRFSDRESPNALDGICANKEKIVDVIFFTKTYVQDCSISFTLNGKECGGDCSYDSALGCYTYMESIDCPSQASFPVKIILEKENYTLTAESVVKQNLLTLSQVLEQLQKEKKEKINSLQSKGCFLGEIRVRLLYDDGCFYYVGITDRQQNTYSVLMNAETGAIIAEREG